MSADHVSFVKSTELHHKPLPSLFKETRSPAENQKQGYVAAGSLVAFTENVTAQAKQDILDATLFAQLAANRKYDRETDVARWYKYYVYVLDKIGFVGQEFVMHKYDSRAQSFMMDKVVLEILEPGLTSKSMAVAAATIDALGKLPGDDRSLTVFDNQSSSMGKGNFQIGACDQAENGDVTLGMGAFYFSADKSDTRFLFGSYSSSSITLHYGFQYMVLNQAVYAVVRDNISLKLGNNAQNLIGSIKLD